MSLWKLACASLTYFWRTNLALGLGVAVGTAVLTGALLVGDSVRGSLKALTVERLGRISEILIGEQFFRAELAASLDSVPGYTDVIPAILINQATVEGTHEGTVARSQGVTLVGCDASFWNLQTTGSPPQHPQGDEIVLNEALAEQLGVTTGDTVLIRVGKPTGLSTDSPLARKDDLFKTLVDLTVIDVLPTRGLGRFSLQASQQLPLNAFVALNRLQDGLDQEGRVNALLLGSAEALRPPSDAAFAQLQAALSPELTDLGLRLEHVQLTYRDAKETQVVSAYDTLTNARMIFSPENLAPLESLTSAAQPAFTYLATKLQRVNAGQATGPIVPYSTVSGIDSVPTLGPFLDLGSPFAIADDAIVLNSWTAEQLEVQVGDMIRVTYFEPETSHGEVKEVFIDLKLTRIAPLTHPDRPYNRRREAQYREPPTLVNDPHLTPDVKGITDAETIEKWDAPFPMDRSLLRGADDDYWQDFRATPKAFVSLSTGQKLWGSRFGNVTSFRFPASANMPVEARASLLAAELKSHTPAFGLRWLRAKTDGLAASKGTTPFDALFFGFSMFIIAAALLLVSLLLRLNLEHRARQAGTLAAVGFANRQRLALFVTENTLIATGGCLLGVALGVGYAQLMLLGLRTLWLAAVVVPFMSLTITPTALITGFLLGWGAAVATIVFTLTRLARVPVTQLMAGTTDTTPEGATSQSQQRAWLAWLPIVFLLLAFGCILLAPTLPPEPQAGAFFGAGTFVLAAILLSVARWLRRRGKASSSANLNLASMAFRNLTRNPTRSTLTIGLVAAACFLIMAISAFRLAPTEAGTGGFELVGQSDVPLFSLEDTPPEAEIIPLRLQSGDDASCRNLFQSSRPQIIGITDEFIAASSNVGALEWAASMKTDAPTSWNALSSRTEGTIPVVLDKNTAMYGMQIYGGVGTTFQRDYGTAGTLTFEIVGLLSGSIFQGSLLIHEDQLLEHFPRVGGYQYLLVNTAPDSASRISTELEQQFSDQGLDLVSTRTLLTELLAVQNTYLSTFQSLGGLGLLLGTFGLVAVQLRNVLQRRSEFALLRATGYRNDQLSLLVLYEHGMLLLGGFTVGILAALTVVLPHLLFGGASLPGVGLLLTLLLIALLGLLSGVVAQRSLQATPLLPALRGD